jgi:hypothetical protein
MDAQETGVYTAAVITTVVIGGNKIFWQKFLQLKKTAPGLLMTSMMN